MSYEAPYAGLCVVDLSQGIAGPYCTMLLAQYGADVIKVEPPEGDWSRQLSVPHGDHTPFSIVGNLGKRSIVLDLKTDRDRDTLWRLVERADVFVEGFRPGVIERLGFGYSAAEARNPRILYVSVSGFGQDGPLGGKPAMDPVLQAFTGFMVANQDPDGRPHRAGPIVVDMSTALYGFQAVSAALFARLSAGHGRKLELSLMQGAANLQSVRIVQTHLLGHQPQPATAPNGAFPCADGHLLIVVLKQTDFVRLCEILALPELAADPRLQTPQARFEHRVELNERVAAVFRTRPVAWWNERLTEAGLQNERVQDYPDFLAHPQVAATGLVSWLTQPGLPEAVPVVNPPGPPKLTPGHPRARAPTLGQHTEAILAELELERAATGTRGMPET